MIALRMRILILMVSLLLNPQPRIFFRAVIPFAKCQAHLDPNLAETVTEDNDDCLLLSQVLLQVVPSPVPRIDSSSVLSPVPSLYPTSFPCPVSSVHQSPVLRPVPNFDLSFILRPGPSNDPSPEPSATHSTDTSSASTWDHLSDGGYVSDLSSHSTISSWSSPQNSPRKKIDIR